MHDAAVIRCIKLAVLWFCATYATFGVCQGFETHTSPVSPLEGSQFQLYYYLEDCDGGIFLHTGPLDRDVEVIGLTVNVTVDFSPSTIIPNPTHCSLFTGWHSWTVGPLPAGQYTLSLTGRDPEDGGALYDLDEIQLSIRPVALQPRPTVIPTTTIIGTGALAGLLALIAAIHLGRRMR